MALKKIILEKKLLLLLSNNSSYSKFTTNNRFSMLNMLESFADLTESTSSNADFTQKKIY